MMGPRIVVSTIVLFGAIGGLAAGAGAGRTDAPAAGEAKIIFGLQPGNFPEGIAVDEPGDIYLGNRRLEGDRLTSEILKLSRDGVVSTFSVLGTEDGIEDPGASGVLGLATDVRGDVYAALVASDPALHGVWRISADGSTRSRLLGSEQIVFPNALAFDPRGNLYVTDSFGGAVWRFPDGEGGAVWVQHELLEPAADDPLGFPLPGANGIGFAPPDRLYVANTEKGLIALIPIHLSDGAPEEPVLVAEAFELLTIDGIAVDVHGQIHGVVPGFSLLGSSPLVRVDPATGSTASTVDPSAYGEFDVPLSLAFGRGARDSKTVFVTNGDLPGVPGGPGPGIVQANVGVAGSPVR